MGEGTGRPSRSRRSSQAGRPSGTTRPSSTSRSGSNWGTGIRSAAERRLRRLVLALVVCILAAGLYHGRRWLTGSVAAPPTLVGVWESADVRYAGRTLQFTPDSVFFGGGIAASARYAIRHVRAQPGEIEATVLFITYAEGGAEQVMRVEYDAEQRTLSLEGAHGVRWRRRMR